MIVGVCTIFMMFEGFNIQYIEDFHPLEFPCWTLRTLLGQQFWAPTVCPLWRPVFCMLIESICMGSGMSQDSSIINRYKWIRNHDGFHHILKIKTILISILTHSQMKRKTKALHACSMGHSKLTSHRKGKRQASGIHHASMPPWKGDSGDVRGNKIIRSSTKWQLGKDHGFLLPLPSCSPGQEYFDISWGHTPRSCGFSEVNGKCSLGTCYDVPKETVSWYLICDHLCNIMQHLQQNQEWNLLRYIFQDIQILRRLI